MLFLYEFVKMGQTLENFVNAYFSDMLKAFLRMSRWQTLHQKTDVIYERTFKFFLLLIVDKIDIWCVLLFLNLFADTSTPRFHL